MILLALLVLSAGRILDPSMSCQILKFRTYNPLFFQFVGPETVFHLAQEDFPWYISFLDLIPDHFQK